MDKFLNDFVSIYSPSTEENEVSEWLVDRMTDFGFDAYQDEVNNAIGIIGSGEKTILLCGHMDTVPGEIKVKVKDGNLYGRGSVDAKGSLGAFILAAKDADLTGKKVIVAGCVEEEAATSKGAKHLIHNYKPDCIIIGEPSGSDSITLGYKGRLLLRYENKKPVSHTAGIDRSVNESGIMFYNKVKYYVSEYNKCTKKIFDLLQVNLRSINSESDGFHDIIRLDLGFRIPIGFDSYEFKKALMESAQDAELKFYGREYPIKADKNNELVRTFLKVMRSNSITPKFKYKTGTSDMNVLGHAFPDVPIVTYGPGDSNLDHTPNEHICLSEFRKSVKILKEVLESI